MKKYNIVLIFSFILLPILANNLNIVENPTAALLGTGEARITQKIYKDNGMIFGIDVGLLDAFQFGVGYGAEHIVGDQEPNWHKYPVVSARFRIIDEVFTLPALAIGIDTQGHGAYHVKEKRFDIKSKGAYFVVSKNYEMFGLLGFDIGANYSFEKTKGDEDFDIFGGMYKTLGSALIVFAEFTAGLNDTNGKNRTDDIITGRGRTYLNAALQWNINEQFSIKFLTHDIFKNKRQTELFDRSIILDYRWFF